MINILFVCHGNICRSPMAEFVMNDYIQRQGLQDTVVVASCATSREEIGNDVHIGTRKKLKEVGIAVAKRAAIQLTPTDYSKYTYLIAMDHANMQNMKRLCGGDPNHKMHLLLSFCGFDRDIADPWYTGNFDATYEDIKKGCAKLLEHIIDNNRQY